MSLKRGETPKGVRVKRSLTISEATAQSQAVLKNSKEAVARVRQKMENTMHIDNDKLVLDVVTCWNCEGSGILTKNKLCPNWGKKTGNKKCQICGGKGRHSHQVIGEYQDTCHTCNGKGTRLEDKFDTISDVCHEYILNNARFIFKGNNPNELDDSDLDANFIKATYSGINVFSGYDDYVDHRNDNPEALLTAIKEASNRIKHKVLTLLTKNINSNLI